MNHQQYYLKILKAIPQNKEIAHFLFLQSMFETGRLKSALFLNNNNGFGMTFVNQKLASGYTTSTSNIDGVTRKWAKYNSIEDSILDRLRLAKVKKYENETQFDDIFNKVIETCYIGCPPNPSEVQNYKRNMLSLRKEFLYLLEMDNNETKSKETRIESIHILVTILIIIAIYEIRIRK